MYSVILKFLILDSCTSLKIQKVISLGQDISDIIESTLTQLDKENSRDSVDFVIEDGLHFLNKPMKSFFKIYSKVWLSTNGRSR